MTVTAHSLLGVGQLHMRPIALCDIMHYIIISHDIVLYCIVLCCIVLYCIVLCCIVLYCIVLYCIALCNIFYYIMSCHNISYYNTPEHIMSYPAMLILGIMDVLNRDEVVVANMLVGMGVKLLDRKSVV